MNFVYRRCCRVHKLLVGTRIGRCGLCGQVPTTEASFEDYLAQPLLSLDKVSKEVLSRSSTLRSAASTR